MTTARWEYTALGVFVLMMVALVIPALLAARATVRDDLRQTDITNLKRALEQYYNVHLSYVTPLGTEGCTASGRESWFFGDASPLLREQFIDAIPHDIREADGLTYRYCVTKRDTAGRASGYFLEAQLERWQAARHNFDEDERRKFHYQILHQDGTVLYRVCGGEEQRCFPPNGLP